SEPEVAPTVTVKVETAPEPVPPESEESPSSPLIPLIDLPEAPAPTPPAPETNLAPEKPPALHGRPKIALIIDDMGLNHANAALAIQLPAAVTLSFLPYATQLQEQVDKARKAGHEVLLHMPMEPLGKENPGPNALLTNLPPEENRLRLEKALASFEGYDGVNNHMGSKFTADPESLKIVLETLARRNLFFLDSRTAPTVQNAALLKSYGLPVLERDVFVDDALEENAVRAQLNQALRTARRKGFAIAIAHPHASVIVWLQKWIDEIDGQGVALVPLLEIARPAGP
ncbi:MAG: divergent polysaccharide deacetylase family protein, partial [Alphaproteobacteria bacterium]|nr:divergent polysaccharide deacetylase family protein [Alphaproteobacteria bacterium]